MVAERVGGGKPGQPGVVGRPPPAAEVVGGHQAPEIDGGQLAGRHPGLGQLEAGEHGLKRGNL